MSFNIKNQILNLKSDKQGVASLSAILLIGAIIVDIALVGMFIVFIANNTNYGFRLSAQAYADAESGIQDAILRVIRNQYSDDDPYTIPSGATIEICDDSDASCNNTVICNGSPSCAISVGKREIVSDGQALTKRRRLRATLDVDPHTGEVRPVAIYEISL
ncbi:MAG: hypothetical protein AAB407_03955 [Patescibacteria group bacterium]